MRQGGGKLVLGVLHSMESGSVVGFDSIRTVFLLSSNFFVRDEDMRHALLGLFTLFGRFCDTQ